MKVKDLINVLKCCDEENEILVCYAKNIKDQNFECVDFVENKGSHVVLECVSSTVIFKSGTTRGKL